MIAGAAMSFSSLSVVSNALRRIKLRLSDVGYNLAIAYYFANDRSQHSEPRSGGHFTEPYEQKTQQSPGFRAQQGVTARAFVKELAGVDRHGLALRETADRTN